MSESFDLNQLKQSTSEFIQVWRDKFVYLSECVQRLGLDGIKLWLKSHYQMDDLKSALDDLLIASHQDDFRLSLVEATFSSFNIPSEDIGQAEWFRTADQLLVNFEQKLINQKKFDVALLTSALKELKFIIEADEFHQRYQLEPLQQQVREVYQNLSNAITEYKNLEKEKMRLQVEQEKLKVVQLKNEKEFGGKNNEALEKIKQKEKEFAMLEKKLRHELEKEKQQMQMRMEQEIAAINGKQASIKRQYDLQDAYSELQIEEKIKNMPLSETIKFIKNKIDTSKLDRELQFQLIDILEKLES